MNFVQKKRAVLVKLEDAKYQGEVDREVYDLLDTINDLEKFYTTSSCAGRFVIMAKNKVRDKYNTSYFFKTHNPEEIINCIDLEYDQEYGELWLMLEAPNFHIICNSIESANKIHKSALNSGLGYSKIQSVKPSFVVEILGTGRVATPIGKNSDILIEELYFKYLLNVAKSIMEEDQKRLKTWEEQLKNDFK